MDYKDLHLLRDTSTDTFKWNDKEISILRYLPIDYKYDIEIITLQKSFEDGVYNPLKMDVFFHLNLVYSYTDIIFSAEDREDEFKLYDELKSSGFLDAFLQHINPNEYGEMLLDIEDMASKSMKYQSTAASVLKNFINDLPANAEAAAKIVDNFNPEKYQAVIDFAKAANGGREIE